MAQQYDSGETSLQLLFRICCVFLNFKEVNLLFIMGGKKRPVMKFISDVHTFWRLSSCVCLCMQVVRKE